VLRIRDVYPGSRILIFTNPGSRIQASKRHRIRIRKTDQFLNYKSLNQIRILSLLLGVELTEYESIMKKCLWQLLSNPFVWTIVCKEKYRIGGGGGGGAGYLIAANLSFCQRPCCPRRVPSSSKRMCAASTLKRARLIVAEKTGP
jgi:hypothetical protein